ncbi:MAG: multicopper oxidase domain-containing protein [Burkholderiales bacterium]|nr:multicopper oxidase domain-containing protein [Burkholderiales bacterium]
MRRREFLAAGAALALLPRARAARASAPRLVRAAPARAAIAGSGYPDTEVWAYDGTVPGPELRYRQGERLSILVENRLPQETTVHWHGIRLPNPMDGVPHLTQPPIAKGGRFLYEFDLPDAGTFWYHPHLASPEQVGRGLYGALVVEERDRRPKRTAISSGCWVTGGSIARRVSAKTSATSSTRATPAGSETR